MSDKKKKKVLLQKSIKSLSREQERKRGYYVDKMKGIFQNHIGEDKGITAWNLFYGMFGNPERYNLYEREFYWSAIMRLINYLKRNSHYFIINHKGKWFIPTTLKEYGYYEEKITSEIHGLKSSMKKCREYVEQKEWKKVLADKNKD
jgi:hypothetical protein